MSIIPSLIENHIEYLKTCKLEPYSISSDINPIFIVKEDNILPFQISFKPNPICTCQTYKNSSPYMVCHHILYILINYYRIDILSIRMYHKLRDTYYESLIIYIDSWLTQNNKIKMLKEKKRKPYNFLSETMEIAIDVNNINIFNPMYKYYMEDDCVICLDSLSKKQLMLCSECYNYSHLHCMTRWLHKKQGCHFCRDNPNKQQQQDTEFPDLSKSTKII